MRTEDLSLSRRVPGRSTDQRSDDASLTSDARALHRSLAELIRLLQFRDRDRICCHEVTVSQCYALQAVVRDGPMRLNDLASFLYLDKSTTSRVVDSLQRKGYLLRSPDPSDRRAVQLEATGEGRRLAGRVEAELQAESEAALAGLDSEVRQGVLRVLTLLIERQARCVEFSAGCCRWRPASVANPDTCC
ncbi:MAG: MarR family transcriptional regulator [Thermoanaerobaculia bacterium]|nr:MarR family transcriptional regulator [Thermoanaerobaculia bacterium]